MSVVVTADNWRKARWLCYVMLGNNNNNGMPRIYNSSLQCIFTVTTPLLEDISLKRNAANNHLYSNTNGYLLLGPKRKRIADYTSMLTSI